MHKEQCVITILNLFLLLTAAYISIFSRFGDVFEKWNVAIVNSNTHILHKNATETLNPAIDGDVLDDHIMTVAKKKEHLLKLLSDQQDQCPGVRKVKSNMTLGCACGNLSTMQYRKNMVDHYYNYDLNLLEKCFRVRLPLDSNAGADNVTPLECWPRVFMLVSYPTSGNELARTILSKATNTNLFLSHYREGHRMRMYNIQRPTSVGIVADCLEKNIDTEELSYVQLPIAIMGKPMLFKSHWPKRTSGNW